MARRPASEAANVLRACLAGPFPSLRAEAARLVADALRRHGTRQAAADELGIGIRTLDRMRAEKTRP